MTEINIVVIGSANTDVMARGAVLPGPGQSVDGDRVIIAPGGKGVNQAVGAARLGAQVALVSCVGADARGDALLQQLVVDGVDTRCVRRHTQAQTGMAVIQVGGSGQKQTLSVAGANDDLTTDDVDAAAPLIRQARVLLLQLTVPLPVLRHAVRLASDAGVAVILDPGRPVQLAADVYPRLTAIKPNVTEAEALTGIRPTDWASARHAARHLLERGVDVASVQAGDHGNLLAWAGGDVCLPHFRVESVDATGAGDAFAAGLAVAVCERLTWDEAGWLASAAAALTTTGFGAQPSLPERAQVDALLATQREALEAELRRY